jgi:GT2 family glycosyltransferase/tetratricopeptide (TPR) repeat protein/SAM-dependent methyltransferase
VPAFARRSTFALDHFERYYGVFFSLLDAGERICYLDADEWEDGVSTLLKNEAGDPLLLHCWYTRYWATSHHTRRRYQAVIDFARRAQGLEPYPWPPGQGSSPPPVRASGSGGEREMTWKDASPRGPLPLGILDLIPHSARRLLAIGGGPGELIESVKARQPAEVVNLVVDEEPAAWSFAGQEFDCILCPDRLAYLREPARLLAEARRCLAPGGRLVAQVPNVRHHEVVAGLLEGKWAFTGEGSRPDPPVRFFTRREIEKLFDRAGFTIRDLRVVPGPGHAEWVAQGRPAEVNVGGLRIGHLPVAEVEEFYAGQYLVCAEPAAAPDFGLTSIILVTHNQLEYTRLCIDSIRLRTDEPYELIVVDNASTDGTADYLRSLSGVKGIVNAENRGFPAAANQGIGLATGRQVLLLNNDCLVTSAWLRRLLQALYHDAGVGLVGPCSNCVSGEQQVPVTYDDDLMSLDGFAWDWGKQHDVLRVDTDRLVGFCLLIHREVIDEIGLLDERFGVGCFEDDDYCLRALRAGFRAVIARDAFVHHFGGQTFRHSNVDFAALMRHNQQLFRAKWTAPEATDDHRRYAVRLAPGGGLRLTRSTPLLSLCMIVRDNARTLPACLESIRPWVDEMVVVDTGSTDDTPRIAERLGARVVHFPWCDSFAAARNESLRHARGAWVFWMDSDDVIDADNGRQLRELARRAADPAILGYGVQVHCPGPGADGETDITVVDHVKLFRNRPDLRFQGRIHEQILPAIRRAGGDVALTDLFVVHAGCDHSPEGQRKKLERDLRLLHLELREQPDHPFTLFNLGMTHADVGEYEKAVDYLTRSLQHCGPTDSHLRKVYALLVHCHTQRRRYPAAWETCQEGRRRFPADPELRFREAVLLQETGRLREAARAYEDLLRLPDGERYFRSSVRGLDGFMARHNLAIVYTDLGDLATAEAQWRRVVAEVPRYRPGWRGLGDNLLRQGKLDHALALAERLLGEEALRAEGLVLQGQAAARRGDAAGARRALERAIQENPAEVVPWRALCQVLFEAGAPAEAEQALRELVRRDPTDAASHHNLGTVLQWQGRPAEAVAALRHSLDLRPDSVATYLSLGQALHEAGRLGETIEVWEQVLRLDSANPEAEAALNQARRAAHDLRRIRVASCI